MNAKSLKTKDYVQRNCKRNMEAMTYASYVLVTGGSGGIGSICRLCPSFGFTPIIGYKTNADKANILAKEVRGLAVRIDMGDGNSILNAVNTITKRLAHLDP